MSSVLDKIANIYKDSFWKNADAMNYMVKERGLSEDILRLYNIGYSSCSLRSMLTDDEFSEAEEYGVITERGTETMFSRIVFPIYYNGNVVSFYGRYLGSGSYSSHHLLANTSKGFLYNYWMINKPYVIIVESPIDCLTLVQAGFDSVACYGVSIQDGSINQVSGKDCYILFDDDDAGKRGAKKVANSLLPVAKSVHIASFPGKHAIKQDVNNYFMRIKNAGSRMKFILKSAAPISEPIFIPHDERIKKNLVEDTVDIVKVGRILFSDSDYIERGGALWVRCPHHGQGAETNRSLWIGGNKNIFTCFGCGIGGGPVRLVSWHKNCSISDAVDWIQKHIMKKQL